MLKRGPGEIVRIILIFFILLAFIVTCAGIVDSNTTAGSLQETARMDKDPSSAGGAAQTALSPAGSGNAQPAGNPAPDPSFIPAGDSNLSAEIADSALQAQEKSAAAEKAGHEQQKPPAAPAPVQSAAAPAAITATQLAASPGSSVAAAAAAPATPVSAAAAAAPAAEPARVAPFTLGQAVTRNLRVRIQVSNQGSETAQNIRLEIPMLADLNSPYQVRVNEGFSPAPAEISGGSFGNRTAHFLISSLPPGESATITLNYKLRVNPFTANFSAYKGAASSAAAGYLQPSPGIESNHAEIVARANEITAGASGNLEKARAIYSFVLRHVNYDAGASTRNKGALSALQSRTGVCEDYAALFVALCRASGIPARMVNGYADPRGTGEAWNFSAETLSLRGYRHSWAELHLEGIGWLPVDPTMDINNNSWQYFGRLSYPSHIAQNYLDNSIRVKFQGGQLAATWEEKLVR